MIGQFNSTTLVKANIQNIMAPIAVKNSGINFFLCNLNSDRNIIN